MNCQAIITSVGIMQLLGEGMESGALQTSRLPLTLGGFYPNALLLPANYIHLTLHLKYLDLYDKKFQSLSVFPSRAFIQTCK